MKDPAPFAHVPPPPRGASVEVVESPRRGPAWITGAALLVALLALGSHFVPLDSLSPPTDLAAAPPAVAAPVVAEGVAVQSVVAQPVVNEPLGPGLGDTGPRSSERDGVEVVFVLDTTGSMGGLIRACRQKVWAIANRLADLRPQARLALGFVAFRDHEDRYLTKVQPLTEDLEAFAVALDGLQARGGGDEPEAVDAGLNAALDPERLNWSHPQQSLSQLMFLMGDAPPHASAEGRCQSLVRQARQQGITLSSVLLGSADPTRRTWSQLAALGGGQLLQVEQSARVQQITTPFDGSIAALQQRIEGTVLAYGSRQDKQALAQQWGRNGSLDMAGQAERACANSKLKSFYRNDLLQALETGALNDVGELSDAELPGELQGLGVEERRQRLAGLARQRAEAKQALGALVAKRDAYLRQLPNDATTFDAQLLLALEAQLSAE